MAQFFINESGQRVGLCPYCNLIKPDFMLRKDKRYVNSFIECYTCGRDRVRKKQLEGDKIKLSIIEKAGGCVRLDCHMRYPRDFLNNFQLDHIDPTLKIHDRETESKWIASNSQEFWVRVFPNLQVLCAHHHQEKSSQEQSVGGILHTDPWDEDYDEDLFIDFNEIKPVLPGFEEYANPLT